MSLERKNTLPLKLKVPRVEILKALSSKLTTINEEAFKKYYDKLLSLLTMKVNVGALVALAQYYDTFLRCFTFQDFQLAPTIEEFKRILGRYLEDYNPFTQVWKRIIHQR